MESKDEECKEVMNLAKIDEIVSHELLINVRDANTTTRIHNLFVKYMSLLRPLLDRQREPKL